MNGYDTNSYEEIPVAQSAKRCGVQHTPWMGDWFTSWSPRNDNNNAEGTWDHWVDLALHILSDPLTKIVRPDRYVTPEESGVMGFYDESLRTLTAEELAARFRPTNASDAGAA